MHERNVLPADLVAKLPDGLEEREALDVTDGPAHLDHDHVGLWVFGGSQDLLVEGCECAAGVVGGREAVGVGEADRVRVAEPRGLHADPFSGLVDGDPEGGDRLACGSQPLLVGGRRDEHLGEVDDADQPCDVSVLPAGKKRARLRMVRVGAVERADQHIGVEDYSHRCASSSSSVSRYPGG